MNTSQIVACSIAFCGLNANAHDEAKLMRIRGNIVAFRPAERLGQVVSGVINQEAFLLRLEGKRGETVKVFYEHYGYSEISGRASQNNADLLLKVRRDHSCDDNYGKFVSEAPVLTSEDKSNSLPSVTTLGGFRGLPPSYELKCYRLERGKISTKVGSTP